MPKGWDRASLAFRTRPNKIVRDVSQRDLMVPTGGEGRLRLFGLCFAAGVMLSLLWVWTILMLFAVAGHGVGRMLYPIVAGAAVLFTVALYLFSTWDFERQSRWGREA